MLKNVDFFLKKSSDPCKLLKDKLFTTLLKNMISVNSHNIPNVKDVMVSKFVRKHYDLN